MTTSSLISHILRVAVYLALQLFIFRYLVLFNVAFCFLYVGAILLLPKETSNVYSIVISFLLGMVVDAFYNTMGVHAAAATFIGFLRPFLINILVPFQTGIDEKKDYSIFSLGPLTYSLYAVTLVTIHHLMIFFLELNSGELFFITLLKVLCSVIFTNLVIVLMQFWRNN